MSFVSLSATPLERGQHATTATPKADCLPTPLPVHRSALLSSVPGVLHGITRRVCGMGIAGGNVGYSPPRDTRDAWAMRQAWCDAIGADAERLVAVAQVHGAEVVRVDVRQAGQGARPESRRPGSADALITDSPGLPLATLHADCLPILFVDPDRPAVWVAHAGWRGTVAGIAGATVRAMADAFGSRPERLLASLGPAIGPCCYEVGEEVVEAWRAGLRESDAADEPEGPTVIAQNGRRHFDLWAANVHLLRRAGLGAERIDVSAVCTRCGGDAWFSHRGQGLLTGRFAAIIALADGPA